MDSLTKKTLKTSRDLTYTYYVSPAQDSKPTLLLVHGWPDSAALWSDLTTNYLIPAGYGIVAIDCLGYAGTSKPTDSKAFGWDGMTADLCEILDAEDLQKVISLGHDWGSALAQRMWNFHPERVNGLVMMNVAYIPITGNEVDLAKMEAGMTRILGYFNFWYWHLFTSKEGAGILGGHLDSLFDVMHGSGESMLETFCKKDGIKDFLLEDRKQEVQPYATEEMRKAFIKRMEKDGFESPLGWYRSSVDNTQSKLDKVLPEDRNTVTVPTLFVGGSEDKVCVTGAIYAPQQQGLLPHLTIKELEASHWSMLAKPKEMGEVLIEWLKSNY